MNKPATQSAAIWLFLATGLLAAAIYYPGLSGDYMFDDQANLLLNRQLAIDTLDLESLQSAAFSSGSGPLRRPVSMLTFSLNRYFFGVNPYSYKVINLVIHILTGLALFVLSRKLISSYRQYRDPELSDQAVIWLPVVVSGLWLVHPLNLSSVLYIVQRMTSLASLFMVCGLCLYVSGRQRMLSDQRGMPLILAGLVVFGGLAIFSKETGALLPLYMLVLEVTLFRFRNSRGHLDKRVLAFFILTLLLPMILYLVNLASKPVAFPAYLRRDFTLSERLFTEMRVLVFYLKLIFIPSIKELGLYHDDIAISRGLLDPPTTLFSLLTLAGLILGALLLLRKRPLVSLGILWFFTGHALESTIIPLEIAHEHRNYLADFGIILAASSAIAQAPLHRLGPSIRTVTPLLFLFMFSNTTWLRAGQWSDNINHAVYEAMHHPESSRAAYIAGRIHARLALVGHAGNEEKAFIYLKRASELNKSGITADAIMIKLSYLLDKPFDTAWFDTILDKLTHYPISPGDVGALNVLQLCIDNGCEVPHETMESIFRQALANKSLPVSRIQHADFLTIYGYYTINKRDDFHKALELFEQALALRPEENRTWINLITTLTLMDRLDDAENFLAKFRTTSTHGGNEKDYQYLLTEIEEKRKKNTSAVQLDNAGKT